MANPHPSLVETEWLAEHLNDPNLRLVDTRWQGDGSGRAQYIAGHLPGAIHLDWQHDLGETRRGVRYQLLSPRRFAAVMSAAGINNDTLVVAYAEADQSGAARLWWALRYYGHDRVVVLNGGLTKWRAEGRPLTTVIPRFAAGNFVCRPRRRLRATAAEITAALAQRNNRVRLVDSRPPEQYAGLAVWTLAGSRYAAPDELWVDADGRRLRRGHIPGAVSLPAVDNLDPATWTYRSLAALRARAEAVGLQPTQRIITYCGVGISAAQALFALHLAGYPDVALYDASWDEWGADPARPIVHPL